jgi:hypothetical protein
MKPKIEKIDFGVVVINGETYRDKDLIVYWDGTIQTKEKSHIFSEKDFKNILKKKPETVIISTGFYDCVKVDNNINVLGRIHGVKVIKSRTQDACKIFNNLEEKAVIFIHPTC